MYNWINKDLLKVKSDTILSIDDSIPNAFLTILMETDPTLFEKVNKWIESHQEEYSKNSRKRALIGSDLIKLNELDKEETTLFVEKYPILKDLIIHSKL